MVSCSGFGLPMHAQLLRLFVNWKRCNSANNGRKPQKAHSNTDSQPASADQQCKKRSTQTRPQAASHDKKHQTRTEATGTEQHTQHQTAISATEAKTRDHSLTPSNTSTEPIATREAPGKPPGARNATWPPAAAANPGSTQTTQQYQR